MRINKLEITNFRCFEHLEINLNQKCNVLVGINGAGKSSLLDALSIAADKVEIEGISAKEALDEAQKTAQEALDKVK